MDDSLPVFIGDEVSAAGYRLAGLRVRVASADSLVDELHTCCEQAPLVLISSELAATLPEAQRDRLLARLSPPVLVVPDVRGRDTGLDLSTRLRRQLGVLE